MSKFVATLLFAHGAGQGKSSEFMTRTKVLFEQQGIHCQLFNFPYMDLAESAGKPRPPDKLDKLEACFEQQIQTLEQTETPLFIGGKSMGGRVASMLLQESTAFSCICFGYPFHPPGKPDKTRIAHLQELTKPLLIVQGTRDPFGKPDEIASYDLAGSVSIEYIENGEHSFKTPKRADLSSEQSHEQAVLKAASFIRQMIEK